MRYGAINYDSVWCGIGRYDAQCAKHLRLQVVASIYQLTFSSIPLFDGILDPFPLTTWLSLDKKYNLLIIKDLLPPFLSSFRQIYLDEKSNY